jgi:hypothetical protein
MVPRVTLNSGAAHHGLALEISMLHIQIFVGVLIGISLMAVMVSNRLLKARATA